MQKPETIRVYHSQMSRMTLHDLRYYYEHGLQLAVPYIEKDYARAPRPACEPRTRKTTFEVEKASIRQPGARGWIVVEVGPRDAEGRRFERVTSWNPYPTKSAAQAQADALAAK